MSLRPHPAPGIECSAEWHGTEYANRMLGCVCDDALTARRALRPAKVHSGKKSGRPEQWLTDERAQAVRRLTQAGASAAGIAIRLGISERTVTWHRARLRRLQETSGYSLPTVSETS